jgi:chromosome segregation ATPase
MGFFKSLFGKSDEDPYAGLSAEAIRQKIAEKNNEIEQLKRKLPSTNAMDGMAKSAAWTAEMQAKIKAAEDMGDEAAVKRLEAEFKEATTKTGRIGKHIEEVKEEILACEDEIELLERALAKLK